MHVTDWLPTLFTAAGGDVAALGKAKGFEGIDGVDQWAHLTGATYTTFGPLALPVV